MLIAIIVVNVTILFFPPVDIVVLPYIIHGVTPGVLTQTVPDFDDGTSPPIVASFPLGSQNQSLIYVSHLCSFKHPSLFLCAE